MRTAPCAPAAAARYCRPAATRTCRMCTRHANATHTPRKRDAHATHMRHACYRSHATHVYRSPARPATPPDAGRFWAELKCARALASGSAPVPAGEAAGGAAVDGGAAAAEGERGAAAEGGALPRAVLAMDLAAWVRCCTHLGIFPDLLGKAELSKVRTACAKRGHVLHAHAHACICYMPMLTYMHVLHARAAYAHVRAHVPARHAHDHHERAHRRPSLPRRSPRHPSASSPRPSASARPEHRRPQPLLRTHGCRPYCTRPRP